jgi:hypothetical protein
MAMHFQALTVVPTKAGSIFTHTSEEIMAHTRELLIPILRNVLDPETPASFELGDWLIHWTPGVDCAKAEFYWHSLLHVSSMTMTFSDRTTLESLGMNMPQAKSQILSVQLPAAITEIRPSCAMVQGDEIGQMMLELGDLDRCLACVYFELMEKRYTVVQ